MSFSIRIKAGDTISRRMRLTTGSARTPVDLTGAVITAKVRLKSDASDGAPVGVMTCTADPDQGANLGVFAFVGPDTTLWPIRSLECDVRFVFPDWTTTTRTFPIEVARAVSR